MQSIRKYESQNEKTVFLSERKSIVGDKYFKNSKEALSNKEMTSEEKIEEFHDDVEETSRKPQKWEKMNSILENYEIRGIVVIMIRVPEVQEDKFNENQ